MESKIEDRWPGIGRSSKDTVVVLKQVHMRITFRVKKKKVQIPVPTLLQKVTILNRVQYLCTISLLNLHGVKYTISVQVSGF